MKSKVPFLFTISLLIVIAAVFLYITRPVNQEERLVPAAAEHFRYFQIEEEIKFPKGAQLVQLPEITFGYSKNDTRTAELLEQNKEEIITIIKNTALSAPDDYYSYENFFKFNDFLRDRLIKEINQSIEGCHIKRIFITEYSF